MQVTFFLDVTTRPMPAEISQANIPALVCSGPAMPASGIAAIATTTSAAIAQKFQCMGKTHIRAAMARIAVLSDAAGGEIRLCGCRQRAKRRIAANQHGRQFRWRLAAAGRCAQTVALVAANDGLALIDPWPGGNRQTKADRRRDEIQ